MPISEPTEAPPEPESLQYRPPGQEACAETTEFKLVGAMDRAALAMVEQLEKEDVPWLERKQVFQLTMDWLTKSRRLRGDEGDSASPTGVEAMREFITSEIARKKPVKLTAKGYRTKGEGVALAKALETET